MTLNKLFLKIGGITLVISPIALLLSCSENNKKVKNDVFSLQGYEGNLLDATVKSWTDGDTLKVDIPAQKGQPVSSNQKIRITGIDTPELHKYPSGQATTGEEFKWAKKAKEFGASLIPSQTKIKIFTDGSKSYDRLVGSIFYGGNEENLTNYKNYSVEILKKGLTLPFVKSASEVYLKSSVLNITGLAMADAYNWALETKKGLFATDLNFLKTHGKTDDSALLRRDGPKGPFDETNIYDIWDKAHED